MGNITRRSNLDDRSRNPPSRRTALEPVPPGARAALERAGRRLLIWAIGLLFAVRSRPVKLPANPKILVVRLDERVGNLLLLTPLLASLRLRFPSAAIHVLASTKAHTILADHPAVDELLTFRKRALLAADGPLRIIGALRRARYDLVLNAENARVPSSTQTLITRLAGAAHSVGFTHAGLGKLYSAPVSAAGLTREVDMRLALLEPLPGAGFVRETSLGAVAEPEPHTPLGRLVEQTESSRSALLNIGGRLAGKRLTAEQYAAVADLILQVGLRPLLTYGPGEEALAQDVKRRVHGSTLAPPTNLHELAALARHCKVAVSCDTGPMHIAVATGTPTCGIFVSTDPQRYGYDAPHGAVDIRNVSEATWLRALHAWLRLHH